MKRQFVAGADLGYTTFEVNLLDATVRDGQIEVRCSVRNTGNQAGGTVVQLYGRDDVASVVRPVRQLLDFHRIDLGCGVEAELEFRVPLQRLSYTLPDGTRGLEAGTVTLMLGLASDDIHATGVATVPAWRPES